MRIISDFHDYYDCVQGMGQDRALVYQRKRSHEHREDKYPFLFFLGSGYGCRRREELKISMQCMIGFCGKLYPTLELSFGYHTDKSEWINEYCYGIDDVDAFIETHCDERELAVYNESRYRYNIHGKIWPQGYIRQSFAEFFERAKLQDATNIFTTSQCPIFVASVYDRYSARKGHTMTYNDRLADYGFYRIVDTYQAFQQIAQFMSNVAQPLKAIPEISDETMAEIKGFDKWSFRKMSSKGK